MQYSNLYKTDRLKSLFGVRRCMCLCADDCCGTTVVRIVNYAKYTHLGAKVFAKQAAKRELIVYAQSLRNVTYNEQTNILWVKCISFDEFAANISLMSFRRYLYSYIFTNKVAPLINSLTNK